MNIVEYKSIEPEVAGEIGHETVLDRSSHPPILHKLHFVFTGWLGDDIIETFPCYLITEDLKNRIESEILTGIDFKDVKITRSSEFKEMYPDRKLPKFYWAKITGTKGKSDFFMSEDHRLISTQRAYDILCKFNLGEIVNT